MKSHVIKKPATAAAVAHPEARYADQSLKNSSLLHRGDERLGRFGEKPHRLEDDFEPRRNAKRLDDGIDAGQSAFHCGHFKRIASYFFELGVTRRVFSGPTAPRRKIECLALRAAFTVSRPIPLLAPMIRSVATQIECSWLLSDPPPIVMCDFDSRTARWGLDVESPATLLVRADEIIEIGNLPPLGVKQTWLPQRKMSAYDPKRTYQLTPDRIAPLPRFGAPNLGLSTMFLFEREKCSHLHGTKFSCLRLGTDNSPILEGTQMRTLILGGLLASAMLVSALAQTNPPPASPAPAAQSTAPKAHGEMWRSSKLIGLNVYNDQDEKLGAISEILLDKSGKVDFVVIGVGGFLGIGQHDIMVEMSKLKFVDEPVRTSSTTTGTTGSANRPATTTTNRPPPTTAMTTTKSKWYPDHAVLSGATKDSLKNMAAFTYD